MPRIRGLQELISRQYQFADQVQQHVEQIDPNPLRLHAGLLGARFHNLLRCMDVLQATQGSQDLADAASIAAL